MVMKYRNDSRAYQCENLKCRKQIALESGKITCNAVNEGIQVETHHIIAERKFDGTAAKINNRKRIKTTEKNQLYTHIR